MLSDRRKVGSIVGPFPVWIGSAGRGVLPVGGLRCTFVYRPLERERERDIRQSTGAA